MAKKSDHDMVVAIHTTIPFIKENLISVSNRMDKHEIDINNRFEDLNKRIRPIEKWQWITIGGAGVISALINWVM